MPSPVILLPVLQAINQFRSRPKSHESTEHDQASEPNPHTWTHDDDRPPRLISSQEEEDESPSQRRLPSPSDLEAGTAVDSPENTFPGREPPADYPAFSDSSDDDDDVGEGPSAYPFPAPPRPTRFQTSCSNPTPEQHRAPQEKGVDVDHARQKRRQLSLTSRVLRRRHRRSTGSEEAKNPGIFKRIWDFIWGTDVDGQHQPFIPNYRWLPIVSGIVSPFAILLEIPGLTEPWYVRTANDRVVEYRTNPVILEIGMAVSMAAAVIANVALIVRFLEKRIKLSTIIAMVFLVFHDIINVVTVTIFGVVHRFDDGFTYGEAFWMTVCSTVASLAVTGTLAWDWYFTPDFALSGSGLTRKQRSLVVIVMILICYIALGSLVYSFVLNLTFQDGLYFTVVSLETIGFGDIAPSNPGSRVFAIIYNTLGIINVGLAITTTRETIVEAFENSYRKRRAALAKRKHQTKVLRESERARRIAIEHQLKEAGLPLYVQDPKHHHTIASFGAPTMKLNEEGLKASQLKAAERHADTMCDAVLEGRVEGETAGTTVTELRANEAAEKIQDHPVGETQLHPDQIEVAVDDLGAEAKRGRALEMARELQRELQLLGVGDGTGQEDAYVKLKIELAKEQQREFTTKLLVAWSLFLTFWLVGAGIFMRTEKWSFGKGLYFCWVSFSTIGYGDVTPTSPAGRAIFVVWALWGVAAMTILISVLSEAYSSRYKSALQNGSFERAIKSYKNKKRTRSPTDTATTTPAKESPTQLPDGATSPLHPRTVTEGSNQSVPQHQTASLTQQEAQEQLDSVPLDVIRHAKEFHDHVKYFTGGVGGAMAGQNLEKPPEGIRELLNEIAEAEKMDDRMKMEMLDDEESRRVLFMMSYERAFRKLIDTAQKAVHIIAVRDSQRAQFHSGTGRTSTAVPPEAFARNTLPNINHQPPSQHSVFPGSKEAARSFPRWKALLHQRGATSEPDLRLHSRHTTRQGRDEV